MEWFIVLILIGGMLSLELMNSAIERVVDLDHDGMSSACQDKRKILLQVQYLFLQLVSAIIGLLIFIPKWFN